jgi:FMN reductase (NADPH)
MKAQHLNPVIEVMMSHTSVRRFKPDPIPDELLETVVRASRRASTHFNVQAYTIISIEDRERKERLFQLCGEQAQVKECPVFFVVCPDLHRFEVATRMHADESLNDRLVEGLILATIDAALVLQNLALACESVGLAICMIGAIRKNPQAVSDLLGLPSHVYAASGLCAGYAAQVTEQKPRLPLDAIWHRETYRDDDKLREHIRAYDEDMVSYHLERGLHTENPRWSAVMTGKPLRLVNDGKVVSDLIRDKGFLRDGFHINQQSL